MLNRWNSLKPGFHEGINLVLHQILDLKEVGTATGLSRGYLIKLLRSEGLKDREIGVQSNKRRRPKMGRAK